MTAKEYSYSVATPAGTPRGTGGTMQAVEPERVQFLPLEKVIPMSLLVRSLSIFHVWILDNNVPLPSTLERLDSEVLQPLPVR